MIIKEKELQRVARLITKNSRKYNIDYAETHNFNYLKRFLKDKFNIEIEKS